jgi:hypothetical protein
MDGFTCLKNPFMVLLPSASLCKKQKLLDWFSLLGKAYIFNRNGSSWSQQAQLTASDGAFDDRFGYCVGISGNNIICGAPQKSIDSNFQQGKVYFFYQELVC